jgi:MFS family permease
MSGTILWVVGFSTLADTVGQDSMGKTVGLGAGVISAGVLTGPMLAGWLNEMVGYWPAWLSALAIVRVFQTMPCVIYHLLITGPYPSSLQLLIDIIMRLTMVEIPRGKPSASNAMAAVESPIAGFNAQHDPENSSEYSAHERSILLPRRCLEGYSAVSEQKGFQFYVCVFKQRRFTAAQYLYVVYGVLISSFSATLPLHVRHVFGWGSFLAGMMFLALQVPQVPLSPLFGWVRDRIGTRLPTSLGFFFMTPVFFLLGLPGNDSFPWAAGNTCAGKMVYVMSIVCVGILSSLLNGVGSIESKCECILSTFHSRCLVAYGLKWIVIMLAYVWIR